MLELVGFEPSIYRCFGTHLKESIAYTSGLPPLDLVVVVVVVVVVVAAAGGGGERGV